MRVWFCSLLVLCVWAPPALAGPVQTFDDIEHWVGSGASRAALAIDWDGPSSLDTSLVWGYRFDGSPTGEDMLRAVVTADPRLFIKFQFVGAFGIGLMGVGYDDGDGNFSLDDGTIFDAGGLAQVPGPSDGAVANDAGDRYVEGWFTGFWNYNNSNNNPFDGGSWTGSQVGLGGRTLANNDWDGLAFTADFQVSPVPLNAVAAVDVPEPGTIVLVFAALPIVAFCYGRRLRRLWAVPLLACGAATAWAGPFAAQVISFTPGVAIGVGNPAPFQTDGSQALGEPAHDTALGSQVGVFYGPFVTSELVIVGAGGQLTVKFDQQVVNDAANPFGIDLLVFGNAAFGLNATQQATAPFEEPGAISVSQDGATWFTVPGVFADTGFPTLGYSDTAYTGSDNQGGTIKTDFTRPVDPAFDPLGKTEAQINAAYAGAGGGTGVDLSLVGLPWIQYVRVSQSANDTWSTEVDGFADVSPAPEPSTFVLAIGAIALTFSFTSMHTNPTRKRGLLV